MCCLTNAQKLKRKGWEENPKKASKMSNSHSPVTLLKILSQLNCQPSNKSMIWKSLRKCKMLATKRKWRKKRKKKRKVTRIRLKTKRLQSKRHSSSRLNQTGRHFYKTKTPPSLKSDLTNNHSSKPRTILTITPIKITRMQWTTKIKIIRKTIVAIKTSTCLSKSDLNPCSSNSISSNNITLVKRTTILALWIKTKLSQIKETISNLII